MRVLAFDPGTRRVGVAVSDEEARIALPHGTLEVRSEAEAAQKAAALALSLEGIEALVVGLPLRLDGTEGMAARRARRFAQKLEGATGLPLTLWDERLTSAQAERSLREQGVRSKGQRGKVDRIAATLLLQSFLDASAYAGNAPRAAGGLPPREG